MNTLIYLITAITCAALGVQAWDRDRADPVHRSFLVLALLTSLTFISFTLHFLPGFTFLRALYAVSGAFLPPALLTFIDRFFRPADQPLQPEVSRFWFGTGVITTTYLLTDGLLFDGFGRSTFPDVLLALSTIGGFGWSGHRLWRIHQRSAQTVERSRLRILIGLLGAAILSTTIEQLVRNIGGPSDISTLMGSERSFALQGAAPPVGAVLGTACIYSLHHVVQLHRLLDLTEVVARLVALTAAATLLVLTTGVTMAWSEALADYPLHIAFQMFLGSALFLSVYDPLRSRLEAITGEWFNRQGRLLESTLNEVEQGLSRVISLDGLGDELLGRLQASGRAPLVSLYLWNHEQGAFVLTLSRGPVTRPLVRTIVGPPFTDGFRGGVRSYARSELQRRTQRRFPGHEEATATLRTLDMMDADLTLAIHSGGSLLGWLNLKAEAWTEGFTYDEVRRLSIVVDRAAVILENIHSFRSLHDQQRLAALGTMAAGLAHEIRNPLAGIKGAAQYLQTTEGTPEPEEFKDLLSVIVDETDRLATVVEQFLDYARPMNVLAAPTDVVDLSQKVVQLVQHTANADAIRIRIHTGENLPWVMCDADKIRQVLHNLLRNAVEAVGPGGAVDLHLQHSEWTGPDRTPIPVLEIAVDDNGPGLAPETLEKLFIPFFTTKRTGTGLGLPISRRLVEAHHGDLTARSRPEGGTRVQVRLPIGTIATTGDSLRGSLA